MSWHELASNHWSTESFTERMTTKQWREHLLREDDKIVFKGRCRRLVGKPLGCGVIEVSKAPLETEQGGKEG